ncbi:MAG: LuxR C-terminal-related transcriptional regulator [Chitinophagaceae bacterium]
MPLEALVNGLKKYTVLTKREKQILHHANEGLRNKEIAERLCISPGTVKKHFDNIFKKLQAGNKIKALNKIKN